MTVDEAKQLLQVAGLVITEEKRLGNETRTQLRVNTGAIVNIYDKGTLNVQGMNKEEVEELVRAGVVACNERA
jgi:predicted nucleotide-binding protein